MNSRKYNKAGQATLQCAVGSPDPENAGEFINGFDRFGNVRALTQIIWASVYTFYFDYDDLRQLTGVAKTITAGGSGTTYESFTFDAIGNRTDTGYAANMLNQYTSLPGSVTISYDADGNTTRVGDYQYIYDGLNRITTVYGYTGAYITSQIEYAYDFWGRRISRTNANSGITTRYAYDGDNLIAELDGSGNLIRRYNWDPTCAGGVGGLLSIMVYDGNGDVTAVYVPQYNAHGDIVALIDQSTGAVAATFTYNAFGQRTATGAAAVDCPLGWQTQYHDAGTIHFRHRDYTTYLGRFLQPDPIGEAGGENLYVYCKNQPVSGVDPLGLDEKWDNSFGGKLSSFFSWLIEKPIQKYLGPPIESLSKKADHVISGTVQTYIAPYAEDMAWAAGSGYTRFLRVSSLNLSSTFNEADDIMWNRNGMRGTGIDTATTVVSIPGAVFSLAVGGLSTGRLSVGLWRATPELVATGVELGNTSYHFALASYQVYPGVKIAADTLGWLLAIGTFTAYATDQEARDILMSHPDPAGVVMADARAIIGPINRSFDIFKAGNTVTLVDGRKISSSALAVQDSQLVLRPANQQPFGGGGNILRDGQGATAAEIAASTGGVTGGSRIGQAMVRDQMFSQTLVVNGGVFRCWRCGVTGTNPADFHLGHRNIPTSMGGNLSPFNVTLECAACNLSAGNRGAPSPGMSGFERGSPGAPYGR